MLGTASIGSDSNAPMVPVARGAGEVGSRAQRRDARSGQSQDGRESRTRPPMALFRMFRRIGRGAYGQKRGRRYVADADDAGCVMVCRRAGSVKAVGRSCGGDDCVAARAEALWGGGGSLSSYLM